MRSKREIQCWGLTNPWHEDESKDSNYGRVCAICSEAVRAGEKGQHGYGACNGDKLRAALAETFDGQSARISAQAKELDALQTKVRRQKQEIANLNKAIARAPEIRVLRSEVADLRTERDRLLATDREKSREIERLRGLVTALRVEASIECSYCGESEL